MFPEHHQTQCSDKDPCNFISCPRCIAIDGRGPSIDAELEIHVAR